MNDRGAPAAGRAAFVEGAADPVQAAAHFEAQLSFETDCWDVHDALERGQTGFVVLDVRSPASYAAGHVPGAVNLPHGRIVERALEPFPADTLFVVYCSGPHCNGADRGALRLARLGRKAKKMIGGIEGWKDEGLGLTTAVPGVRETSR
ncbi:MAG TPA: rhodanese-like domain-containing protein [Candidatus Eisenbacteria bacterium]